MQGGGRRFDPVILHSVSGRDEHRAPPAARVHILTRTGCCLCDEAIAVAREVCAELGVGVTTQDVDSDPGLRAEWNDHVPVTFVDGARHELWHLDPVRLRDALTA